MTDSAIKSLKSQFDGHANVEINIHPEVQVEEDGSQWQVSIAVSDAEGVLVTTVTLPPDHPIVEPLMRLKDANISLFDITNLQGLKKVMVQVIKVSADNTRLEETMAFSITVPGQNLVCMFPDPNAAWEKIGEIDFIGHRTEVVNNDGVLFGCIPIYRTDTNVIAAPPAFTLEETALLEKIYQRANVLAYLMPQPMGFFSNEPDQAE